MRIASCLVAALLAASAARAAEAAGESDPLETQRSLVRSLRAQSGNAEAAFSVYAGLARVSAARAAAIDPAEGARKPARRRRGRGALARAVLESRVERLRPRLLSLYRLTRRSPLEVLLPAEDVAAFAWRARALSSLVRSDLAALDEMRSVVLFQRSRLEELDAWKRQMGSRLVELRAEAEEAAGQQTELGEALQLLQAKARAAGSVLAELARSRAQLQAVASVLQEPESTGFGALRKLPLPAPGTSRWPSGGSYIPNSTPSPCRRGSTSARQAELR
jgi:hypothetical protein